MKMVAAAEVKARFGTYLDASRKEPVVVMRKGRPVAVLISAAGEDWEQLTLARSPKLRAILAASRRQIRAGRGVSEEQFWREVQPEHPGSGQGTKPQKRQRKPPLRPRRST